MSEKIKEKAPFMMHNTGMQTSNVSSSAQKNLPIHKTHVATTVLILLIVSTLLTYYQLPFLLPENRALHRDLSGCDKVVINKFVGICDGCDLPNPVALNGADAQYLVASLTIQSSNSTACYSGAPYYYLEFFENGKRLFTLDYYKITGGSGISSDDYDFGLGKRDYMSRICKFPLTSATEAYLNGLFIRIKEPLKEIPKTAYRPEHDHRRIKTPILTR